MAVSVPSGIWWIFLLQGMAGAALGLLLIAEPGATTMTIVTFLGFYWLVMGLFALVRVFVDQSVLWVLSLLVATFEILRALRHQASIARRDRLANSDNCHHSDPRPGHGRP